MKFNYRPYYILFLHYGPIVVSCTLQDMLAFIYLFIYNFNANLLWNNVMNTNFMECFCYDGIFPA